MGLVGERGGKPGQAATPFSLNWTREGGHPPFLLPLPLLHSPSLPCGGILLGLVVLVGLPLLGPAPRSGRPPLPPLYTGAGGTLEHTS